MNKEYKAKMLPRLKTVDSVDLQHGLLNGIMMASLCPSDDFKSFRRIGEEMFLLKQELKLRGIKTIKEINSTGIPRLSFQPCEVPKQVDLHAKEDVKMHIPTITELLAMPLPTDLPAHGYVTIQLPEKN